MWQELMVAACLMLVIEGVLPFLSPRRWRILLISMLALDDRRIRIIGLSSMLMGVGLLYVFN